MVKGYRDLELNVNALITSREQEDFEQFTQHKEEIAKKLRPIWAAETKKAKEQEQLRRANLNWFMRTREDVSHAMNRLYNYFFGVKSK